MQILQLDPRPLIFSQSKIVLSFSPKSACSHVVVWFLIHEGLLRAANYYSYWPHDFRWDVYYKSIVYCRRAQSLKDSGGTGFTLIRVTRDPAKRLVSCFRHACRHPLMDFLVLRRTGRRLARDGMALVDFHRALRGKKLQVPTKMDLHICAQSHPVWDFGFDRVITLNVDETHLNPGLNAIEDELGLARTEFERYPKFDDLRRSHYAKDVPYTGPEPLETLRIMRKDTESFPKKQFEALPLVQQMAGELHGVDIGRVGSGDSAGRLFQSGAPETKVALRA